MELTRPVITKEMTLPSSAYDLLYFASCDHFDASHDGTCASHHGNAPWAATAKDWGRQEKAIIHHCHWTVAGCQQATSMRLTKTPRASCSSSIHPVDYRNQQSEISFRFWLLTTHPYPYTSEWRRIGNLQRVQRLVARVGQRVDGLGCGADHPDGQHCSERPTYSIAALSMPTSAIFALFPLPLATILPCRSAIAAAVLVPPAYGHELEQQAATNSHRHRESIQVRYAEGPA